MGLAFQVVNATLKGITRVICRVDDHQLQRVPMTGPLILVANHINFLEVPLIYTHLLPRLITGIAKAETWENPALRPLFNLWKAIPLKRGEADLVAIRSALRVLECGGILAIAPEGTRSGHGRLQRGHPGVAMLAQMSGAPLLPIAYHGGEKFTRNMRMLRRTDFNISVGLPFFVDIEGKSMTRAMRQQVTDEIMYQVAALLPPEYRGHYSDLSSATQAHLRFIRSDGIDS